MPTDPVSLAIYLIDLISQGISFDEAVQRLQSGISATAQKEGREVRDDELSLIKGLTDEAEKRRRGN